MKWWPWLGDWVCRWSFGNCWRMAKNTDGAYRQTNAQQPDHCTWNWPETINQSMNNFYGHGDATGAINSDEFWVKYSGKNCWDRQPWCQAGPYFEAENQVEEENTPFQPIDEEFTDFPGFQINQRNVRGF